MDSDPKDVFDPLLFNNIQDSTKHAMNRTHTVDPSTMMAARISF